MIQKWNRDDCKGSCTNGGTVLRKNRNQGDTAKMIKCNTYFPYHRDNKYV